MKGPEFNPADEAPADKESYERWANGLANEQKQADLARIGGELADMVLDYTEDPRLVVKLLKIDSKAREFKARQAGKE